MIHRTSRSVARALVAAVGTAALLAAGPDPAPAQEAGTVSVDPRAGVVFPVGGLDDLTDFSVSAGTGVAVWLGRRVALRGDFRYARLDGETDGAGRPRAPSLDVLHYTAGVEVDFPEPIWQEIPFSFQMNLGAGATDMSGSESFESGTSVTFDQTYATLTGGGKIGLPLSERVRAFVSSEVYLIFADKDDTGALAAEAPAAEAFGTGWTVPLTLGIEARF